MKRKGGIARDRLKEAWSEIASRRTETGYEAAVIGRASSTERSPYPSRIIAVNLAGARGRLSDLPREICRVSRQGLGWLQSHLTARQKSAEGVIGQAIGRRPERSPRGVEGEGK